MTDPSAGETLDGIGHRIEVYQSQKGYRFGIEAPLLVGFVRPGAQRGVDLGTGSGVIGLLLLSLEKVRSIVGVELQPGLADRARRSALHNKLEKRFEVCEADIRSLADRLPASGFDLVVANPPYGPAGRGQVNTSLERAQGRHELLCKLGDVVAAAARLLVPLGRFCVILPPARLPELLHFCREGKLQPIRLRLAHPRSGKPAAFCLLEAVRGARGSLVIEPPLILAGPDGKYTEETNAMLFPTVGKGGC